MRVMHLRNNVCAEPPTGAHLGRSLTGHPEPSMHDDAPPLADAQRATVAVDAMGGDNAPEEIVAGAVAAATVHGVPVVLAGRPSQLRPLLPGGDTAALIRIAPADDSIAMDEGALASRRRPRSSVAVACQLVRRGQAGAVVSAGSTGAIVATRTTAAALGTRPDPAGPHRCAAHPPESDVSRRRRRHRRSQAGDAAPVRAARRRLRADRARHRRAKGGLLTIGAEPGKGNRLARRAHELLAAPPPHGALPIHFTGNVEGSDLLAGQVDVIVTDGFTGNVALKTLEGSAAFRRRAVARRHAEFADRATRRDAAAARGCAS